MARVQVGDKAPDFTLRVRRAYGVPAALGFIPGRVTYVIDRAGTVRHIFNSMTNIDGHVGEALEVVRKLQAEQPA